MYMIAVLINVCGADALSVVIAVVIVNRRVLWTDPLRSAPNIGEQGGERCQNLL